MIEEYFRTARERYSIMQRKNRGDEWPWTDDKIFQKWRFCNVHREDDKTTVWFRENIRNNLNCRNPVQATFIFRWFNRIETAEIIKDLILGPDWNGMEAWFRLQHVHPIVTGAYMMRTPDGMNKLEGVLYVIKTSLEKLNEMQKNWGPTLKGAWTDLCGLPCLGPFLAYEIVTDLRHTPILCEAEDIDTWANAGPGCSRGINDVVGEHITNSEEKLEVLKNLLEGSRLGKYWPLDFKQWELREAEHWACEFHKYRNAQLGYRLKRKYKR
jgi:hypothetical protein